ncbi:uncharacterized protein MEPE_01751 [Melanopsichium pennsylvanicum]|uniref:Uncharacterized protein n=2 Tax=Melanopsichium pennsylvanicum TaxID=63383 RepID=A0AAJ4XIB3_9BASI|nr:hypothetical protein BN887_04653 [Melanopsichium pennsylvanicum 4]SNX83045.1 uncharacterized protein MEPE_01751 [Melanopsichium pennsylvanicum]
MHSRSLLSSLALGLALTTTSSLAAVAKANPMVQAIETPAAAAASPPPPQLAPSNNPDTYNAASGSLTHPPQSDGRHEIRFSLLGCPSAVRPKISGTSGSSGQFTPSPPGSIIVPSDFIGSVYLTAEGCGKFGDKCQSLDLTFMPNANETVKSYINFDAMYGKKFLYPLKARFDDNKDTSDAARIDCGSYDCIDGSRDPDDFISNRIYSSTKGVGVDIIYDCRANTTSTQA